MRPPQGREVTPLPRRGRRAGRFTEAGGPLRDSTCGPGRRWLMPEGETGSAPDSALIIKNSYNSTRKPIKTWVEDLTDSSLKKTQMANSI